MNAAFWDGMEKRALNPLGFIAPAAKAATRLGQNTSALAARARQVGQAAAAAPGRLANAVKTEVNVGKIQARSPNANPDLVRRLATAKATGQPTKFVKGPVQGPMPQPVAPTPTPAPQNALQRGVARARGLATAHPMATAGVVGAGAAGAGYLAARSGERQGAPI